jgi:NAD(P)-dependent dehydrogenase (short-subunit alcohol dehydrogenase family)
MRRDASGPLWYIRSVGLSHWLDIPSQCKHWGTVYIIFGIACSGSRLCPKKSRRNRPLIERLDTFFETPLLFVYNRPDFGYTQNGEIILKTYHSDRGRCGMLISTGTLTRQSLAGRVAVVTGAGGGIGLEAARALIWLGARVVIAEVNRRTGQDAEARLILEFGKGAAKFVHTDVGDERSVNRLSSQVVRDFGPVDVVLNNATIALLGAVKDVPIQDWDASYRVNLRGPVLLARAFLPGMVARKSGVFVCVSSTGTAFMGSYESFKAAQVHLAQTLDDELQSSGVIAFTIGPGFAPTQTALSSIPKLAAMMGKPVDELREMLRAHTLSVEAAGAGFAAAIALAERYRGQEISSVQALLDAGIELPEEIPESGRVTLAPEQIEQALSHCRQVRATLAEQSAGWKQRSIFEQQWLIRTFKQYARLPVEEWLKTLEKMEQALEARNVAGLSGVRPPFEGLAGYYAHLHEMAKGYVKDPAQREEQLRIVKGWQEDVEQLSKALEGGR